MPFNSCYRIRYVEASSVIFEYHQWLLVHSVRILWTLKYQFFGHLWNYGGPEGRSGISMFVGKMDTSHANFKMRTAIFANSRKIMEIFPSLLGRNEDFSRICAHKREFLRSTSEGYCTKKLLCKNTTWLCQRSKYFSFSLSISVISTWTCFQR